MAEMAFIYGYRVCSADGADGDSQGWMETFVPWQRLSCAHRGSHSSRLQLCPAPSWAPHPRSPSYPCSSLPLRGGSLPLSQQGHGRTYWDRRKPSWGGAGRPAGQGKPRLSSLLPLSPPHRTEGPGGPWHCPSCPPAPRSWGVCCSRRAARKGGRERELSETVPETALKENLARTQRGGRGLCWKRGQEPGDSQQLLGTGHGPIPAPPGRGIRD